MSADLPFWTDLIVSTVVLSKFILRGDIVE